MSGYSEAYRDQKHADFLRKWVPNAEIPHLNLDSESAVWFLARARAAEAELKELKGALATLRGIGA